MSASRKLPLRVGSSDVEARSKILMARRALHGPVDPMKDRLEVANSDSFNRAAIEAAKAYIQPLVIEYMDVAAAAEMPRAAFEPQFADWVKELLVEAKDPPKRRRAVRARFVTYARDSCSRPAFR